MADTQYSEADINDHPSVKLTEKPEDAPRVGLVKMAKDLGLYPYFVECYGKIGPDTGHIDCDRGCSINLSFDIQDKLVKGSILSSVIESADIKLNGCRCPGANVRISAGQGKAACSGAKTENLHSIFAIPALFDNGHGGIALLISDEVNLLVDFPVKLIKQQ